MVVDAKRTALSKYNDSQRAAFQVGLAFLNGFGIEQDLSMALQNIRRSASSGCLPAEILLLILKTRYTDLDKPHGRGQTFEIRHSVFAKFGFWASPKLLGASSCQLLSPSGRNKLEKYSPQIGPSLLTQSVDIGGNKETSISQQEIGIALVLACQLGDLDALISLASQRAEPLSCQSSGPTPLHYLFMFDQDEETLDRALESLLPTPVESRRPLLESYCSKPQTIDQQLPFSLTGTPLNFAVLTGSRGAVEALLRVGANPLSCGLEPDTSAPLTPRSPLQSAVSYHQADIFSAVWKACLLRPEWRDDLVIEALHPEASLFARLCARSRLEKWIMQSGDDLVTRSRMVSALVGAVWEFLKSDTDIRKGENPGQKFAQHVAVGLEHILALDGLEVAHVLLNRAAEISGLSLLPFLEDGDRDSLMQALLQIACQGSVTPRRAVAYIEFGELLFAGTSPSVGFRALLSSIRHHNDSLFSTLLVDGRHFNEVDSDGKGVLWHIVESGFSRMVPLSKVLALDLNPDVPDKFGETPLHCAVRCQSLDDTTTLIRAGADVTRKLSDGTTVLHLATRNLHLPMIRCLLDCGASVNAVDDRRQSAIHALFLQAPHEEPSSVFAISRFLLSRGASTSSMDSSGSTPIHTLALWNGEVISKPDFSLLISEMDLAVRGKDGKTVLHFAARHCKDGLVAKLISSNVSVDDQDNTGATPLHALVSNPAIRRLPLTTEALGRLIPTAAALLKARPEMALRDNKNMTALDHIILTCDDVEAAVSIGTRIDLLKLVLDHCCRDFSTIQGLHSPIVNLLDNAWTCAVSNMRWLAAREIVSRMEVDLSLLRWPHGVRFLLFAIERADPNILRLFLGPRLAAWSPSPERIANGRKKQFCFPSTRSQSWSPQKHSSWERQISGKHVHSGRNGEYIPRDILDFVLENQDLYKMGPLGWSKDKAVPHSWPVVDELILACQNEAELEAEMITANQERMRREMIREERERRRLMTREDRERRRPMLIVEARNAEDERIEGWRQQTRLRSRFSSSVPLD